MIFEVLGKLREKNPADTEFEVLAYKTLGGKFMLVKPP